MLLLIKIKLACGGLALACGGLESEYILAHIRTAQPRPGHLSDEQLPITCKDIDAWGREAHLPVFKCGVIKLLDIVHRQR